MRVATVAEPQSGLGWRTDSPRSRSGLLGGKHRGSERIASEAFKKPEARAMGMRVATIAEPQSGLGWRTDSPRSRLGLLGKNRDGSDFPAAQAARPRPALPVRVLRRNHSRPYFPAIFEVVSPTV